MDEHDIRHLIGEVKAGRLSRRGFIQSMVAVGLTVPMAGHLLMHAGVAQAQSKRPVYKPTKRGGGGMVKILMWQGPTLLNPHFASGTKDQYGSRVFYEALASWDGEGNLVANLAAEIPSVANGSVGKDGKSVTWKLKKGVTWHDRKPFTADDVIFNVEYSQDPDTATTTIGAYRNVKAVKVDSHTVRIEFKEPTPFWADALVGVNGMMIPKHLFEAFKGSKSREAPTNLKPVGTGPYKFVDFKPGDMLRAEINPNYHEANRPYFDSLEMKGGGDATSAARAVLQTGEFDYAWNMQVEDELLKGLEKGGKGRVVFAPGGGLEMLQFQSTDPWTEVDGERGSAKSKHPTLSDFAVRDAINYLVDRGSIQAHIYGRTGVAVRNFVNQPARFRSSNTKFEFSIEKANKVLDAAGWKRGSDGIRARDGKKLKYVFQTSINSVRQKVQAVIKQACSKAGIEVELKSVPATVFFSSDVGNPDTYRKFWADLQMYQTTQPRPDPEFFMNQFLKSEISQKENKWSSTNNTRWHSDEYDRTWLAAKTELDPVKRAAMFIKCNDILIENRVIVPIVNRPDVAAFGNRMTAEITGWDNHVAFLKDWFRSA
jgi:peptide/nickel transport system substrate-binding protein